VLDHHIARLDDQPTSNQCDARIGRRLTRDREVRTAHDQRLSAEVDHPADFEHDQPRARGRHSLPERSLTVGRERRHAQNRAVAPTFRPCSKTSRWMLLRFAYCREWYYQSSASRR
jgi:hypothetical protein